MIKYIKVIIELILAKKNKGRIQRAVVLPLPVEQCIGVRACVRVYVCVHVRVLSLIVFYCVRSACVRLAEGAGGTSASGSISISS